MRKRTNHGGSATLGRRRRNGIPGAGRLTSPIEETTQTLSLFTMRVVALLTDAENELNDTISQEVEVDEYNVWEAIANKPRRLRPRLSRKTA